MRRAFGRVVVKLAEKDPNIILLTGDVEQEIAEYKERFADRYFNLGLCEQTIVSMAAGMALEGLRPVVYSITPFLIERAFEQLKVDIDAQRLPVMLVGNHDYPTHGITHRPLDAPGLVKLLKNTVGFFPQNQFQTEKAMLDAYLMASPAVICISNEKLPFI